MTKSTQGNWEEYDEHMRKRDERLSNNIRKIAHADTLEVRVSNLEHIVEKLWNKQGGVNNDR